MTTHPGGEEHTHRMLFLADLPSGSRILDMGAGSGEAVMLMRKMGFDADGIDIKPRSPMVILGNLLCTGLSDGTFDAVISQCSFYVSGDISGAFREAYRILKKGGILLFSDVEFFPLQPIMEETGFSTIYAEDLTRQWREYYLEALWRDDCCLESYPQGRCGYRLLIGRKD